MYPVKAQENGVVKPQRYAADGVTPECPRCSWVMYPTNTPDVWVCGGDHCPDFYQPVTIPAPEKR